MNYWLFLFLCTVVGVVKASNKTILPPRISTPQRDLYLTEGQTEVVLECHLEVGDDPITYRWLKQYKYVTAALGYAYRSYHGVALSLNAVTRNHEGFYECEAANDAGVDAAHIAVHVQASENGREQRKFEEQGDTHMVLKELAASLSDVLAEGNCNCDIMFMLHASSAPEEAMPAQANFVYTIANSIISEKNRVAIVTYSDYNIYKLTFGSGTNRCALRDAFSDLQHDKWSTRIQPVLKSAYKKIKKSDKKCKVLFLVIFGSVGTEALSESLSQDLKKLGVKLFIFEVSEEPIEGAKEMASVRGDGKPYYWRIPLSIWPTIVSYINYLPEDLTGCWKESRDSNYIPGVCVGLGHNCNQTNQCEGLGVGCVKGICRSLNCEEKPDEPGCCANGGGNFWCGDVTKDCKKGDVRCDGKFQCMNGFDEETCWATPCPANMIRCQSSVLCLSLYDLCDGKVDCLSAEDEDPSFCRSHPCPLDRPFRCKSGKCISEENICDGAFKNCEDGDDETLVYCSQHHVCPESRPFKCDYGVCISEKKVCDGVYNCLDAEDEKLCHERNCPADRPFKCQNGKCVEIDKICNGVIDACVDGSDESNCTNFVCPAARPLKCHNGKCIDKYLECDNRDDCGDGSDEFHCDDTPLPTSYFPIVDISTTPSYDMGVSMEPECMDDEYFCPSGHCINGSLRCDGRKDCEGGDDEDSDMCRDFMCPPERPHRCSDFVCVRIILCDGIKDCSDGSDEEDCMNVTNEEGTLIENIEPEPEPDGKSHETVVEDAAYATSNEEASSGDCFKVAYGSVGAMVFSVFYSLLR